MKSELDIYFDKSKYKRGVTYWGDCGTIIGWSKPIKLTCPTSGVSEVGGWHIFKKDKDNSKVGIHPSKITFCNSCPQDCHKK